MEVIFIKVNICVFSKKMNFFYKCDGIWETISNTIKKEFNSEIIHSKKYLKMKKNQPKEGFHCIYTSVILIDSVYRKDKNCYPQVILEKYYFVIIEKKMSNFNDKKFILLILTL